MAPSHRVRRPTRRLVVSVAIAVALTADLTGSVAALTHRGDAGPVQPFAAASAASPATPTPRVMARGSVLPRFDVDTLAAAGRTLAVTALLAERANAVLHHDRAAFLATVDPRQTAFRSTQGRLFDNLAAVPVSSWTYQLDPTDVRPADAPELRRYHDPVWSPTVVLHYTLAGYDGEPTADHQQYTFVEYAGRWLIASDSDFDGATSYERTVRALWDFGPVTVVRGQRTLVLGHPAAQGLLSELAGEVDAAVPRVSAVWGTSWAQRVVVEVPGSQAEMAKLVPDAGDLSQIAAVATAELPDGPFGQSAVGDRVIVNPTTFGALGPVGRQVVLTHEVTHVASRAATGPLMPDWLVEGFADYVGYLDTSVPVPVAASELAADLRAGGAPTALPGDTAFNGANAHLAESYEQAWLAVRLIAARDGTAGLLRFYRAVGAARSGTEADAVGAALATVLHTTPAAFTADWIAAVRAALS